MWDGAGVCVLCCQALPTAVISGRKTSYSKSWEGNRPWGWANVGVGWVILLTGIDWAPTVRTALCWLHISIQGGLCALGRTGMKGWLIHTLWVQWGNLPQPGEEDFWQLFPSFPICFLISQPSSQKQTQVVIAHEALWPWFLWQSQHSPKTSSLHHLLLSSSSSHEGSCAASHAHLMSPGRGARHEIHCTPPPVISMTCYNGRYMRSCTLDLMPSSKLSVPGILTCTWQSCPFRKILRYIHWLDDKCLSNHFVPGTAFGSVGHQWTQSDAATAPRSIESNQWDGS